MKLFLRDYRKRMSRYYLIVLQGDLGLTDGETVHVVREWGRIGSPGTVRIDAYPDAIAAEAAAAKIERLKKRKGYVACGGASSAR
jgi:predicted DNA-binding WGR domain protein